MEYQILVITSRHNNNVGGVSVNQKVIKFSGEGEADTAHEQIELAAKHDDIHTIVAIKLY